MYCLILVLILMKMIVSKIFPYYSEIFDKQNTFFPHAKYHFIFVFL